MVYKRDDSFPFYFEPNGISFGSKSKENCHQDHIPFDVKGNENIVFSVKGNQPAWDVWMSEHFVCFPS